MSQPQIRVFLVDDQQMVRAGFRMLVDSQDDMQVVGEAADGDAALRLAVRLVPDVVLMDEPCSALDPISTLRVEELIQNLKEQYTIVIVTHNMQQASRVSDYTAFMLAGVERVGELVEIGETRQIFTNPKDQRTEDYITGRFG